MKTPLRENLDQAKAGYGATRYRGDLARDVLGAMAMEAPTPNVWRGRALAIAAAIALSATTFFAGSYFERASSHSTVVAITTTEIRPVVVAPPTDSSPTTQKSQTTVAAATTTEEFTLVPSLASADKTTSTAQASAQQSSMDFSHSVPSVPMLFSLATLADQETQTSTEAESEQRS